MARLAVAVAGLLCLGVGACGSSSPSHTRAFVPTARTVVMRNIAFNPQTIRASVGQTITWVNRDDAPHNVTYVSGPRFVSSATFKDGGSFRLKLTHPGTIHYMCTIHPGMNGTIVVSH
jgi:plastocyanin